MSLSQIATALNGQFVGQDSVIEKVFTDSRKAQSEGLFVALKGPSFDAHNFVSQALACGADAVLVDHDMALRKAQIIVADTGLAFAKLAGVNRAMSQAKFIAITGSSGKTTVKEMVASILSLSGKTLATKGNFNNEIGVPSTLLRLDFSIQYGVIELGASKAGDIAYTAAITQPNVALVNNIGAAHLQGFGSLQGVAQAKAEIYQALAKGGVAIINNDGEFAGDFASLTDKAVITYAMHTTADVRATDLTLTKMQSSQFNIQYKGQKQAVTLALLGMHNVANALAAASCCLALDIPLAQIAAGLSQVRAVKGRLLEYQLGQRGRLIDDSYNANLASVMAAIDLLENYEQPRILVLGDLAELGDYGTKYHHDIGTYAAEKGIDQVYTIGKLTQITQQAFQHSNKENNKKGLQSYHFNDQQELIKQLQQEANAERTILVKGSRSAAMDKVVEALIEIDPNSPQKQARHSAESSIASLQGEY